MTNRYGVDTAYFKKELKLLLKSLPNRTPGELSRYLRVLADVAEPEKVATEVKKLADIGGPEISITARIGQVLFTDGGKGSTTFWTHEKTPTDFKLPFSSKEFNPGNDVELTIKKTIINPIKGA